MSWCILPCVNQIGFHRHLKPVEKSVLERHSEVRIGWIRPTLVNAAEAFKAAAVRPDAGR
jgi:hypothetical protein